ncbi:MAG: cytidylate kinase [Pseudohongiellaceae bacterium]|jgi:cytidylate kinase
MNSPLLENHGAPVIAIDGPSGSGKGAVASVLAQSLGFHLLDSGALYRVLGIALLEAKIELDNINGISKLAMEMKVDFGLAGVDSVALNGADVSLQIRSDVGSDMASRVGAIPQARAALMQRQLDFRQAPGLIADGRDMGTVVFPDAVLKIFLTASVEQRAERRYKQLIGKGIGAILPDLLRELKERDRRDSQREVSPLQPATDAIVLDTTELSLQQVIARVSQLAHRALP